MHALTEFLFPTPARRSAGAIVHWWEKRRLPYNIAVGGAGLVTLAGFRLFSMLPPDPYTIPYVFGPIVVFGLGANLCYCLGPATEIAIEKLGRGKILPTGPALYRMGLTFAVGLTLFPALLAGLDWGIRILKWIL